MQTSRESELSRQCFATMRVFSRVRLSGWWYILSPRVMPLSLGLPRTVQTVVSIPLSPPPCSSSPTCPSQYIFIYVKFSYTDHFLFGAHTYRGRRYVQQDLWDATNGLCGERGAKPFHAIFLGWIIPLQYTRTCMYAYCKELHLWFSNVKHATYI